MNQLRRRFVNLVAENCTTTVYSLHRLNVERLFYPSTAEAEAAKPTIYRLSLPAPTHSFRPAVAGNHRDHHIFALANPQRSEGSIFWRSQEGHTVVHDVDSHTTWSMPSGLQYFGQRPLVISVPVVPDDGNGGPGGEQEDLYVMSSCCSYLGFQVLRLDHSKPKPLKGDDPWWKWGWERLPPPPLSEGSQIYSHAVLDGGRYICVSAYPLALGGTYLFDTVRREWMWQAANDWLMPFFGEPQYVPDLNLWLGVSWSGDDEDDSEKHHLCASSDLGGAVDAARGADKPSVTVAQHWKEGLETPVGWETDSAQLLDLGDGRFCVAKIIYEVVDDYDGMYEVFGVGKIAALLTGVELVRGAGDGCGANSPPSSSSSENGFRMVVHKSLRYIFREDTINWVL